MYTNADKINEFLGKTIDSADLTLVIAASKKIIDQHTGRDFGSIADAYAPTQTDRLFDGNGMQRMLIDDMFEVLAVDEEEEDELIAVQIGSNGAEGPTTFTAETNFIREPGNANSLGVPVTTLYRKGAVWPCGVQNIKVTAHFGFSLVPPADIQLAATVLASGMYLANHTTDGPIKREKIGNYDITYGGESEQWTAFARVQDVLASYRRIQL